MKTPVIFVVDRDPAHLYLIKYNLGINKFANVHTFATGAECLYRLQKGFHPDFLITNFFTGNFSGFDFLRSVLELSPSIRVIFFDKFEDSQLAGKLLEAGACDYVVKYGNPDNGMSTLLKNVRYLAREKALTGGL